MNRYGLKIKKISAGTLYEMTLGIRDYYDYTHAMFHNSLFSYFLQQHGLHIYQGESTRDLICLDFDFGSRSYEQEKKRIKKLMEVADEESKKRLQKAADRIDKNEPLYQAKSRDEIREFFYQNGVDIVYTDRKKDGSEITQTIHYEMLYRTSAKAKLGQVIFINEEFYEIAYDYLTMGLGKKLPADNAKIVELSAYAPLTTSTTEDTMQIPVKDILILKDQDSSFLTLANVVKAEAYDSQETKKASALKKCTVVREETMVSNTIWDGMGLIESSILPAWINGMALLRNHFFKMCGFRGHIQLFFQDWCRKNGHDYETYQVTDMFGNWHYLKDIKVITTDNSIKWKKFTDLMGGTSSFAYTYWCERIKADQNTFGIVKTDHASKLENLQQMSYQMINTLPCTKADVADIAATSISYVEQLKKDNLAFERFLRKNANEVNHYEMLADLYHQNPEFQNSTWFRNEKKKIIFEYVYKLRTGKITVEADNLTVCGNPYALLLYAAQDAWEKDPSFSKEDGCIQCYTTRFADQEYLCAFRNPHNSPNNICCFHNVYSREMERYFPFSRNIIAVNCIGTDIEDRANGMDFDSDFMYVTNQPTMVHYAAVCYRDYPTIVNALQESGITYPNTKAAYAQMDNKFSKSRRGIGWSSNLAQLAMTYYWTELQKEQPDQEKITAYYDNFVILSVLAQIIIDECKREYEIDGLAEIDRIQKMDCMKHTKSFTDENGSLKETKCDFPYFMKYTKSIPYTKDGKDLPLETVASNKDKLNSRIDPTLVCPMNWLIEQLDKIQNAPNTATVPTKDFFLKISGKPNNRQMSTIRSLIEDYDSFVKGMHLTDDTDEEDAVQQLVEKSNHLVSELQKIKIGNPVTINRLIETALGLENGVGASRKTKGQNMKYTRKILNYLYKMDREKFLSNFKS